MKIAFEVLLGILGLISYVSIAAHAFSGPLRQDPKFMATPWERKSLEGIKDSWERSYRQLSMFYLILVTAFGAWIVYTMVRH